MTTPAAIPQAMNAAVTAFGDQPSLAKTQVAAGETLRMYRRPAQCSSLSRSITACGWPAARSSARDGPGIVLHSLGDLDLGQRQALEDGVAARSRARRVGHGLGKVRLRHADLI